MTKIKTSRVLGVIPARWASSRLPGKPLAMIAGKPMIQRVAERVVQAKSLDAVLVATDDRRIADAVASFAVPGVKAVMTRADHPSGTDRIAEAMAGVSCDAVINIQGDEPLMDPELIDRLAAVITSGEWDMATAAAPITNQADLNSSAVVKVVFGRTGQALYFSRAVIPHVRDAGTPDVANTHWRHIGVYAYRCDYLLKLVAEPPCRLENMEKLEQLRALYIGCRMNVLQVDDVGVGVDTPEDIIKIEKRLKELGDD
ncbi:MAG: 3-deoxy-manno-octulosonate cytidylyltransferase synthetase [Verrucomicrobiota bacterium]|jgi:3-deoxy-manno-octulosonate cytidylyltransferase (CMP-KDO synthetase)|nr:3-deoxy-manno-octulosonate cytidylyltransferase synthetase [Verrucomicrobiota bacterium]